MPDQPFAGYASRDPRGYFHYHERPGGRFISKEHYLSLLHTSRAGYHGWAGRLQPWGAIGQILGPGIPTTARGWWRVIEHIDTPTTVIPRRGATQYMITVQTMDQDGNIRDQRLFLPIGDGYDPVAVDDMVADYLKTGTGSPPREVEEDEELMEIDRHVTRLVWEATPGAGPAGG